MADLILSVNNFDPPFFRDREDSPDSPTLTRMFRERWPEQCGEASVLILGARAAVIDALRERAEAAEKERDHAESLRADAEDAARAATESMQSWEKQAQKWHKERDAARAELHRLTSHTSAWKRAHEFASVEHLDQWENENPDWSLVTAVQYGIDIGHMVHLERVRGLVRLYRAARADLERAKEGEVAWINIAQDMLKTLIRAFPDIEYEGDERAYVAACIAKRQEERADLERAEERIETGDRIRRNAMKELGAARGKQDVYRIKLERAEAVLRAVQVNSDAGTAPQMRFQLECLHKIVEAYFKEAERG